VVLHAHVSPGGCCSEMYSHPIDFINTVLVVHGGLVVTVLAIGPEVYAFKPGLG
jgi:hypothetical protein